MSENAPPAMKRKGIHSSAPPQDDIDEEILAHLPSWARRFRELRREAEAGEPTASDESR
jgi:hypothetical protein